MNEMPNSPFFNDSFECIKKLMMSKLTYTSTEVKKIFITTVLEGMVMLFNVKNITERGLLYLLEANIKFISNI